MTSGTDETLAATPNHDTAGGTGDRPTAELHELRAGDTIGRYEIVGVLGAGGMGRVYRARDPDLNRDLAIKVLHRAGGGGASPGLEHRLLREAQAMARLKHTNLATVYDVGAVRGEVFIAFEFIDGKTLAAWMREPGRTTEEKLAALIAAGRGLEAAHSAGVIHRDFKPDNVLVARDGDVKVVDFGLARGVDAGDHAARAPSTSRNDALASDLTMTGSLLGTPAYMAPEQHKGLPSDARTDQFGFAVSAWEALYGERPFRGKNLETLATAICGGAIEPPPPRHGVPPHVEAALRRAMSVDAAARFADMGALLAALTTPITAAPRPRRRWLAIGAGLAVVVGAGALYVGGQGSHPPPPDATTSQRGGSRGPTPAVRAKIAEDEANRSAIRATIRNDLDRVSECYQDALELDETIGRGDVAIDFEIGGDGHVKSTRIVSDGFQGKGGIAECVAAKSFGWTFPPSKGGGTIHVTYPFSFAPGPDETDGDEDEPPPPPVPPAAPPGAP